MRKYNGKSNVCGEIVEKTRLAKNMSREDLAKKLQLAGLNVDRTHILRIEKGRVIVKDFELLIICNVLGINYTSLESELNRN